MPMSRLLAGTWVRSRPATVIRPASASSSPAEQPQRGGLAAAGRPEQGDQLAGLQGQVEPVQRGDRAVPAGQPVHPDFDGGPASAAVGAGDW